VTEVTPLPLENTPFSDFFDFSVLRPPSNRAEGAFLPGNRLVRSLRVKMKNITSTG